MRRKQANGEKCNPSLYIYNYVYIGFICMPVFFSFPSVDSPKLQIFWIFCSTIFPDVISVLYLDFVHLFSFVIASELKNE